MDSIVVIIVLSAALLHSTWHAIIKRAEDRIAGLAGMNVVSMLAALCCLPWVGTPKPVIWLILVGSVILHNAYKLALARLYRYGDLSHSFPMARGMSPLAATVLAMIFLGQIPNANHLFGVVVICGGLFCLSLESGTYVASKTIIMAAVTGLSVGAYSVIDGYGVRLSEDWVAFTVWLVLLDGGAFVLLSHSVLRPDLWATLRKTWRITLFSGILGVISFSVFLWALVRAPVGPVAALREVSVLFASMIGVTVLGERFSLWRLAGAALVTAGVGVLALL